MYILAQDFANYLLARMVDLFPLPSPPHCGRAGKTLTSMLNKVYTLVDTRHYSENSGPRITELQTNVFVTLMTVFTEILFSPAEASSDDLGLPGIIF